MSQASVTRLWLSAAENMGSPVAVSFNTCTLAGERVLGRDPGHRGSRQRYKCRSRMIGESAGGSISGNFSPTEIDFILPNALGNTGALRPENGIKPIYAVVEKINESYPSSIARLFKYHKQHVNSLTISGQAGKLINWNVDLVGTHEESGVSAPTGTPDCTACYAFSDVIFDYGGDEFPIQSMSLSFNNAIQTSGRQENSLRPTRFAATDFICSLTVQCEYRSDTEALYRASMDGAEAFIKLSGLDIGGGSTVEYEFNFANLKIPNGAPTIPASGMVNMPLTMEAFRNIGSGTVPSINTDNAVFVTKTAT
jgi:hypothetical protein